MVGLNISLRFIFKPSYSPHFANTNVAGNAAGQFRQLTGDTFLTKISHGDK